MELKSCSMTCCSSLVPAYRSLHSNYSDSFCVILPCSFLLLEHILSYSAQRANPVIRNILEGSTRRDTAVRIADGRIIDIATGSANILVHRINSLIKIL